VTVAIEWYPSEPELNWVGIDRVNECGLVITTNLVVGNPISLSPLTPVPLVAAGTYKVRTMGAGFDTVVDDFEGSDRYRVQLRPVDDLAPAVYLDKPAGSRTVGARQVRASNLLATCPGNGGCAGVMVLEMRACVRYDDFRPFWPRVEVIVLRTVGPPGSLFELLLPPGMRVLSGELATVDRLLDDARFFGQFKPFFSPVDGRPSIPIETYLRLMFLKTRHQVGYAKLCVLVGDSISWRRFCRIGLETSVPDESTIRKITRRCGPELIDGEHRELLSRAVGAGVVNVERVRLDSTVVEADIKYLTDSGLLTSGIGRIAARLRRLNDAGVIVDYIDRTVEARALQHSIGVWLRRRSDEARTEVLVITGQLAELAAAVIQEASAVESNRPRKRRQRRMIADLMVLLERTSAVVEQARERVAGRQPAGATRIVSLHEPDARPIRKGRLGKPVEFG